MTSGYKSRQTSSPPDYYSKGWKSIFLTKRPFYEPDCSLGEVLRAAGAKGDNIKIFFRNLEDGPCSEIEEVLDFLGGTCIYDVINGVGTAGSRSASWLDERSYGPKRCSDISCSSNTQDRGQARAHKASYTATELHQRLTVPV